MRRLFLAAVGAVALAGGVTSASAAVVVSPVTNPASLTSPGFTAPATFSLATNLSGGSGTFGPTAYTFTLMGTSALFDGAISSQAGPGGVQEINFAAPTLTMGTTTLATFMKTSAYPDPETWAITSLHAVLLAPGTYSINVGGNLNTDSGSYSGNFNLDPAVPEPATWAMMLLGFGAMGLAIRGRHRPVLAQVA